MSHAHADNDICRQYAEALRAEGVDVWLDLQNMQAGHMLTQDIENELKSRTAFILMMSHVSLASYWVNLERSAFQNLAARDPQRCLIPVRITDVDVPPLLDATLWIDAYNRPFDAVIQQLTQALHVGSANARVPLSAPPPLKPQQRPMPPIAPARPPTGVTPVWTPTPVPTSGLSQPYYPPSAQPPTGGYPPQMPYPVPITNPPFSAGPAFPQQGPLGRTNGLGIAALVLGILSIVTSLIYALGLITGILAIILGNIGRRQVKRGGYTRASRHLATWGIICAVIGILLGVIFFVTFLASYLSYSAASTY